MISRCLTSAARLRATLLAACVLVASAWSTPAQAVDTALSELRRQQADDGLWLESDSAGFAPDPHRITGLALLSFLGAGYDHMSPNKFRNTVRAGMDQLIADQAADGRLGQSIGDHATATMALAEAYGMTNDPRLQAPAQRGLNLLLQWQMVTRSGTAPTGAWPVLPPDPNPAASSQHQACDIRTTMWATMALKSGKAAGLDIRHHTSTDNSTNNGARNGLELVDRWLTRVIESQAAGLASDGFGLQWPPSAGEPPTDRAPGEDTTSALANMAIFVGWQPDHPLLAVLIGRIMATRLDARPDGSPPLPLVDYPATLAVFQFGGPAWQRWNGQREQWLSIIQQPDTAAGLPPVAFSDGTTGGSRSNLMLMTLLFEIYYRYLPSIQATP